jgi:hypothetical protein
MFLHWRSSIHHGRKVGSTAEHGVAVPSRSGRFATPELRSMIRTGKFQPGGSFYLLQPFARWQKRKSEDNTEAEIHRPST